MQQSNPGGVILFQVLKNATTQPPRRGDIILKEKRLSEE
jgi:hypothetical protein